MTYNELKDWFQSWLSRQDDRPIPLVIKDFAYTTDVRHAIGVNIELIESSKPEDRKRSRVLQAAKTRLLKLKESIEEGNHDIGPYGYESEFSNYKPK